MGQKKERTIDERYEKRDAGADYDRKVDLWIKVFAGGCALLTLFGFLAQLQGSMLDAPYVQLSVDYPDQLQGALFGGHPWVVLCTDSKDALDAEERVSDRIIKNFEVLRKKYSVQAGVLDCSRKLPSGKSVYKRLQLKRSKTKPVLFFIQAGDKPSVIPSDKYSDDINVRRQAGSNVIKHVGNLIRARTSARPLKNTAELRKYCSGRKFCGLFTMPGKPSEYDVKIMESLQWKFPNFFWATLDLSLLEFSMTKKLGSRGTKSPGFIAFRRGGSADTGFEQHYGVPAESSWSELHNLQEDNIEAFLNEFIRDEYPEEENRVRKPPAVRSLKKAKRSKSKREQNEGNLKKDTQHSSKAKAKERTSTTIPKEEQLARERQRRQEMEQEQSQHFAEYVVDEETIDLVDDMEEDLDEESVLDLDDDIEIPDEDPSHEL